MFVLLFLISIVAATISGIAGFGGALMLLPVLSGLIGITSAVPVLTIAQLFGNASRVWFGCKELQWKPIVLFISTAVPLTILGSLLFVGIHSSYIKAAIGFFLIAVVINRKIGKRQYFITNTGVCIGGAVTGFFSGVAGSAGPLGAAVFLGINSSIQAYIASEAFTALVMHVSKTLVCKVSPRC
jgi:hypothetical protein